MALKVSNIARAVSRKNQMPKTNFDLKIPIFAHPRTIGVSIFKHKLELTCN